MKLQQLTYIAEVVRCDLNITRAAERLHTSQPGVSKQIRLLEDELGLKIFRRKGKQLVAITETGKEVLRLTEQILNKVTDIKSISLDKTDPKKGALKIATTHTQARYALPATINVFRTKYPDVELSIYQGTPDQLAELAQQEVVDLVIATEALDLFTDLIMLPCYYWNRSILVPKGHPLAQSTPLTLEAIAEFPLVTYVFASGSHQLLERTFGAKGLHPRVALTAVDTDVIKTYVKLGLGVGLIASMAFDPESDQALVARDASDLFPDSLTMIGLRQDHYYQKFVLDFISEFAPHFHREQLQQLILQSDSGNQPLAAEGLNLPRR